MPRLAARRKLDCRRRGRRACSHQRNATDDRPDAPSEAARLAGFAHLARHHQSHVCFRCAALRAARTDIAGVMHRAASRIAKIARPSNTTATCRSSAPFRCFRRLIERCSLRVFRKHFDPTVFRGMRSALRIWHPFTQEALDPPPIRMSARPKALISTPTTAAG